jgi:hypothetical protein
MEKLDASKLNVSPKTINVKSDSEAEVILESQSDTTVWYKIQFDVPSENLDITIVIGKKEVSTCIIHIIKSF